MATRSGGEARAHGGTAAVLAELWTRVLRLDVHVVSPEDNFFDLGGSSLQAAATLSLLRMELAVDVTLADFFAFPTFRSLVDHIDKLHARGRPRNEQLIVRLRPGDPERPAVVLIHPHGGSALSYLALAQKLEVPHAVYGVMASGMESSAAPLQSVDEMAGRYITALQDKGLGTDICLGGWSFGAVIAHEMALRLHEVGDAPRVLMLLDPRLPVITDRSTPVPLSQQIQETWHIDADEALLRSLDESARHDFLLQAGIDQERIPPDMTLDVLIRRARVRDAGTRALLNHTPRGGYPGTTHLFRATGEGARQHRAVADVWLPLFNGAVSCHDVPGTHGRLLKEPAVTQLAEQVASILLRDRDSGTSASASTTRRE